MNNIATFLANNYIWFLVIGIILIFALIGYIVDSKNIEQEKPKTIKYNKEAQPKESEPSPTPASTPVKEEPKTEPQPMNDKTEVLETISIKDDVQNNNTDSIIKEEVKEEPTFEK